MCICMLKIVALFRPRERSLKSLLKYDRIIVGQFKDTSKRQEAIPSRSVRLRMPT